MEGLNNRVLQGFGINGRYAGRAKGGFLIKSENKLLFLKKVDCTVEEIQYQDNIKKYLWNKGFQNIDPYFLAQTGKPYYVLNSEIYLLSEFFNGEELDFGQKDIFLNLVKNVAAMHKIANEANIKGGKGENILRSYEKAAEQLRQYKKIVSKNNKLSDFDIMFLKNYQNYNFDIQESINFLKKYQYNNLYDRNSEFSHKMLKKENLSVVNGIIHITNFTGADSDLNIMDLADIIHRYIKYNENPEITIESIVTTYSEIRPLCNEELKILYGILKFPSSFFKVCRQYYSKKRTWIPSSILSRAEDVVSQKLKYEHFIEHLKQM